MNLSQIWTSLTAAIHYVPQTIAVILVPFFICLVLGLVIALVRYLRVPVPSQLFALFVVVFKSIPIYLLIVVSDLLYILFFDSMAAAMGLHVTQKDVNILYFAFVVLAVGFTPYMSEVLRGALRSVPVGQLEAGYAVGLTRWQVLRRIVIPQMFPAALPQMTSLLIALMKASALTFSMGVMDILNAAMKSAAASYDILEAYVAAAILYWVLGVAIERVMGAIEHASARYRRAVAS